MLLAIISVTFLLLLTAAGVIRHTAPIMFERVRMRLIDTNTKISGAKAARQMLKHNGIDDVRVSVYPFYGEKEVICYNKELRAVFLSREVYHGKNIVAVAIACHEAAHAIQDARGTLIHRKGFSQFTFSIEREANKLTFEWLESDLARSVGALNRWVKDARKLLRWSLLTYIF